MWALIPNWLKIASAGLLCAVLISSGSYWLGKRDGRSETATEALEKAVEAYRNRTRENNDVKALDPIGLCIDLGGVPEDCRTELRRLGEGNGSPNHSGVSRGQ